MLGKFIHRDSILNLVGVAGDYNTEEEKDGSDTNHGGDVNDDSFLVYEERGMQEEKQQLIIEENTLTEVSSGAEISESSSENFFDAYEASVDDGYTHSCGNDASEQKDSLAGEEDDYASYDPYAPSDEQKRQQNEHQNHVESQQLCAFPIFPWVKKENKFIIAQGKHNSSSTLGSGSYGSNEKDSDSADHISCDSSLIKKKMETIDITDEKDRSAETESPPLEPTATLKEEPHDPPNMVPSGILKTARSRQRGNSQTKNDTKSRRHLFPSVSVIHESEPSKHVRFDAYARVLVSSSYTTLPKHLKEQIWWKRKDYHDFKRTINIISQNMTKTVDSDAWFLGAQDTRFLTPMEKSVENEQGAKWWCQYGHSRRGLEQLCSTSEGQFRQENINLSFSLTMSEQMRQLIRNQRDERKLSMAAKKYTSFARDLALAVGRSDADAVRFNFDSKKIKGYHYYMPSKYYDGSFLGTSFASKEVLDKHTHASSRRKKPATKPTRSPSADAEDECHSEYDSFSDATR